MRRCRWCNSERKRAAGGGSNDTRERGAGAISITVELQVVQRKVTVKLQAEEAVQVEQQ